MCSALAFCVTMWLVRMHYVSLLFHFYSFFSFFFSAISCSCWEFEWIVYLNIIETLCIVVSSGKMSILQIANRNSQFATRIYTFLFKIFDFPLFLLLNADGSFFRPLPFAFFSFATLSGVWVCCMCKCILLNAGLGASTTHFETYVFRFFFIIFLFDYLFHVVHLTHCHKLKKNDITETGEIIILWKKGKPNDFVDVSLKVFHSDTNALVECWCRATRMRCVFIFRMKNVDFR